MIKEHYKQLWVNLFGASAMTFGSHIFYDIDKPYVSERIRRHEEKHVEQYIKYTIPGFLIVYLTWYIIGRLQGKSHWESYKAIPFEVEARKAEWENGTRRRARHTNV